MGVRNLETFIEKKCLVACKSVSIKEIAYNHRISYNCQPVLVVGGMSLTNHLYKNSSLEWIYGGQWIQFKKILEDFISRFKSIDVKLVFIFHGTINEGKRELWLKRRASNIDKIASLFDGIKTTPSEPNRKFLQLPTSMGTIVRFAVKELGAEVYQTDRDADDVIVEYANIHKEVFGILSRDSDYIIYNTKMYLSLKNLDLHSLQTTHYDRDCFASYLKLSVSQLPLFACLNGNDFVPFETLKMFHKKLKNMTKDKAENIAHNRAENIAKVIKTKNWTGDVTREDFKTELEIISAFVFGHRDKGTKIQDGLKSYIIGNSASAHNVCIKVSPEFQQAVHERHLNCLNSCIFNLMCKLEYESSEALVDPSCSRPTTVLIYREIRQRCYGIIFNQYLQSRSERRITVKEWCAYHGIQKKQPEHISPLPLENYGGQIPSIEDVWFKLEKEEKKTLFLSILHLSMDLKVLKTIPEHLLVLACILNYLIKGWKSKPLLKPLDVAVFVAQAVMKKNANYLEKLAAPVVNAEAVNLSTLIMRGVTIVHLVYSTCDSPFPLEHFMPWHFFDGKLFHHLYVQAIHMSTVKQKPNFYELCNRQEGFRKEFYELLSHVTGNTAYDLKEFDWTSILDGFNDF